MSLTTFNFFLFLIASVSLYYLCKPVQKYLLLAASIYFYIRISSGSVIRLAVLISAIGLVTYLGALAADRSKGRIRGLITFISLSVLLGLMFAFKLAFNVAGSLASLFDISRDFSWLSFGAVIGMSYYTLTAAGYLIDVYWGNTKASGNIAEVFLFIFFFPQLISGPISRFGTMRPQFASSKSFDMDRLMRGIRRMAWGYFQKFVISERFALIVSGVFGYYTEYGIREIILASVCYAVRLYTDFAGCMDIVLGAAGMFGIDLPENFNAPFFSESTQEFWQRWHISLGTWFKDYVMYPLQKTRLMQSIGKSAKKVLGKKHGKKVPMYLSMSVLWMLIGLWHGGTVYYFVGSGLFPCILLIGGDALAPWLGKLSSKLHIDTSRSSWKWFRRARTVFLISMCWAVICSYSMRTYIEIVKYACSHLVSCTPVDSFLSTLGFTLTDVVLMLIGCILLFAADYCKYKGSSIFDVIDRQNYLVKAAVVYAELITIMTYGMIGSSTFIYFQF